jgi:hypothetical protein
MIKSALIEIRSVLGASLVAAMMALPPHAFAHDAAMHAAPASGAGRTRHRRRLRPDGQLYAVSKDGGHLQLIRSHDDGNHWSAPLREERPARTHRRRWRQPAAHRLQRRWRPAELDQAPCPAPTPARSAWPACPAGAAAFDAPITVHHDRAEITHRFQNILAGPMAA